MATKYGTSGGETVKGTTGADTIYARAGNDTVLGLAGDDRLLGEDGDDVLDGGAGSDVLDGGAGVDRVLYSGIGSADAYGYGVRADLGDGRASTGDGSDTLRRVEDVTGSPFMDEINGSAAANRIAGEGGNDVLAGEGGNDRISGGLGDDLLYGDSQYSSTAEGADQLFGGQGRDSLMGQGGDDALRGEAGDDYLYGGGGDDTLIGGIGEDEHVYVAYPGSPGGRDVVADFVRGEDEISFGASIGGRDIHGFDDLDTNGNDVLDSGDEFVTVANSSYGGVSKASTIIDVSAETGGLSQLVVFGVTGMTAGDFSTYDY